MGQGHPQHSEVIAAEAGYTSIDVQCGIFSKLRGNLFCTDNK
jgi:hypothetical protein